MMNSSKIECWVDHLKLTYNSSSKLTSNSKGVETMIPGFGDPEVVEQLDPHQVRVMNLQRRLCRILIASILPEIIPILPRAVQLLGEAWLRQESVTAKCSI
jgi:hypothetical protein